MIGQSSLLDFSLANYLYIQGDWYKDIYRDKVQGQKYGVVQQTEELVVEALKARYLFYTNVWG